MTDFFAVNVKFLLWGLILAVLSYLFYKVFVELNNKKKQSQKEK